MAQMIQTEQSSSKFLRSTSAIGNDDSGTITYKDLEEVRTVKNPPDVVRRTLEVTCLILATSVRTPKTEPPAWSQVQKKLADTLFLSQVLSCDPASLRAAPTLMNFIAREYFGTGSIAAISDIAFTPVTIAPIRGGSSRVSLRDMMKPSTGTQGIQLAQASRSFRTRWGSADSQDHLSVDRVSRASPTAAVLLRWCATMLQLASAPAQGADERLRAQAALNKTDAEIVAPSGTLPQLRPLQRPTSRSSARKSTGLPDAMLGSPRLANDHGLIAASIPRLNLLDASTQPSSASAPSSCTQRSARLERLKPLQPLQLGHSVSASSKSSAATGFKLREVRSLASAGFTINLAVERAQALALAKIEGRQRSARGAEQLQPLPVAVPAETPAPAEANPIPTESVESEDIVANARKILKMRVEEKTRIEAQTVIPDVEAEDAEEEPWRAFHASYMRADEFAGRPAEEPEKFAAKALKNMENSMKVWEDNMKKAAKPEVEVTHDGHKVVEGGFLETVVFFSSDSDEVTEEHETTLRRVAATFRMRERLHLQLIGSGAELDGAIAVMRRLCHVQQFFESDGIRCNAVHAVRTSGCGSFIQPTWIQSDRPPRYVLCRLHMNDDMELCGHLLGTLPSLKKKTRQQAAWLKSNFQLVTY